MLLGVWGGVCAIKFIPATRLGPLGGILPCINGGLLITAGPGAKDDCVAMEDVELDLVGEDWRGGLGTRGLEVVRW